MIFSWPFWCPHQHPSICFGKICLKLHHHQAFHLSPEIEKKKKKKNDELKYTNKHEEALCKKD
jgi:hypothetical protein